MSINLMAISMLQTNWSATHIGHVQGNMGGNNTAGFNVSENLAWGYNNGTNAVNGWYSEKTVWEEFCASKGWATSDATARSVYNAHSSECAAIFNDVGHYLNLMNPNWHFTGAAINTNGDNGYGNTFGQVYDNNNSTSTGNGTGSYLDQLVSGEFAFTPEKLLALIEEAERSGATSGDPDLEAQIKALEEQLAGLQSDLATAEGVRNGKQDTYESAQEATANAQQALDDLGEKPTGDGLQAAVDAAEAKVEQAKKDKAAADQAAIDAQNAYNTAKGRIEGDIAGLEAEQQRLEGSLGSLQQALDEAKANETAVKNTYSGISTTHDAFEAAKTNAATAEKNLKDAEDAISELDDAIAELQGELTKAQGAYNDAVAAYDPTSADDKKAALDAADAALKSAQAEVDRLTEVRDEMQGKRDAAKAAKDAADAEVTRLTNEKAALEQRIKDLYEEAKYQDSVADAWLAVFAAQTPEDIVKNGLQVATESDDVAKAAANANGAYDARLQELATAAANLESARKAYEGAAARTDVTEQELAKKLADLAAAQEAYDRLLAQITAEQEQVKQEQVKQAGLKAPAEPKNTSSDLPQTGDPATVMAAGIALAGAAAVAGGAHFRRRRDQ